MPLPLAEHGTENRWRTGCRCSLCGDAHNAGLRVWRRDRADRRFPAPQRRLLLKLLSRGQSITDAAMAVGVATQTVHSRSRVDPGWQQRLDEALMAGRDPRVRHGTEDGYRNGRCRCPECRAAHHPPST